MSGLNGLDAADPAAEFLAREQETLAGLEDDLNLSSSSTLASGGGVGASSSSLPANGILDATFGEGLCQQLPACITRPSLSS